MSEMFTIHLPKYLKSKMTMFKIGWSDEAKKFVEARVKQLEFSQLIDEIEREAEARKTD